MAELNITPEDVGAFMAAKEVTKEPEVAKKAPKFAQAVAGAADRQREDIDAIREIRRELARIKVAGGNDYPTKDQFKRVMAAGEDHFVNSPLAAGKLQAELEVAEAAGDKKQVQRIKTKMAPHEIGREPGLLIPVDQIQAAAQIEHVIRDVKRKELAKTLGREPSLGELNQVVDQEMADIGRLYLQSQEEGVGGMLKRPALEISDNEDPLREKLMPYLNMVTNHREAAEAVKGVEPLGEKALVELEGKPYDSAIDMIARMKGRVLTQALGEKATVEEIRAWQRDTAAGQMFRSFELLSMMTDDERDELSKQSGLAFDVRLLKGPNIGRSRLSITLSSIVASLGLGGDIEFSAPEKGGDNRFMPEAMAGIKLMPNEAVEVFGDKGEGLTPGHEANLPIIARIVKSLVERDPNTSAKDANQSIRELRGVKG